MKNLPIIAAASVILVGGGVLVAQHYDKYQTKQTAKTLTAVEAAKKDQQKSDLGVQSILIKTNTVLIGECQKGQAAYAKLPLAVQKITPAPTCTAPAVQ